MEMVRGEVRDPRQALDREAFTGVGEDEILYTMYSIAVRIDIVPLRICAFRPYVR